MDIQALYRYRMSDDERAKWESLKADIINSIKAVNMHIYKGTINIDAYISYEFEHRPQNKGLNCEGYFCVGNYDRGLLTIDYEKLTYDEAKIYYIRWIIRNICHDYNAVNSKEIERKMIKDWRFYKVEDRRELHRIYSHQEENPQYIYNALYDYRKYWFEDELRILRRILSEENFRDAVIDRVRHMCAHGIHWKYDYEKLEFYIEEK